MIRLVILLIIATILVAQNNTTDQVWKSSVITEPMDLIFSSNGHLILSISAKNGVITFGEGTTPSKAAKEFAKQVPIIWPGICKGVK